MNVTQESGVKYSEPREKISYKTWFNATQILLSKVEIMPRGVGLKGTINEIFCCDVKC